MKITLTFRQSETAIPYFNPAEDNPAERHEYVDLRANPAGIDQLPELRKSPELKDLLLQINAEQTIFRTFGCNYAFYSTETKIGPPISPTSDPQTEARAALVDFYLDVGFGDLSRCSSKDDYFRLCGRMAQYLWPQPRYAEIEDGKDDLDVELSIESLRIDGEDKGNVLSIYCRIAGETDAEARGRWLMLMADIAKFLAGEKLECPQLPWARGP